MAAIDQKQIVATYLQEMALLLLAAQPIKTPLQKSANESRGRILADLKPDERELYLAGREVLLTFTRKLADCNDLEMLAKTLQVVQAINTRNLVEYEAIKDQIIE